MFKIVLIGDHAVGKSQLFLRYTKNQFRVAMTSTLGMEFATHAITLPSSKPDETDAIVRAQIWDTAGQDRYRAITNTYYRHAIGVMLVYDISERESFENLERWLVELRDHADDKIKVILVGNKSDLENKR